MFIALKTTTMPACQQISFQLYIKAACFIGLLFLFLPTLSKAQTLLSGNGDEKIEAAKVALLTTKLNLSSNQAREFWPVYNTYNERKKELRNIGDKLRVQLEAKINENTSENESEIKLVLDKIMDNKEEIIKTDRIYTEKFQKIASYRQYAILYLTEREFAKMLIRKLDENTQASGKKGK